MVIYFFLGVCNVCIPLCIYTLYMLYYYTHYVYYSEGDTLLKNGIISACQNRTYFIERIKGSQLRPL